jgi:hypothetical protein
VPTFCRHVSTMIVLQVVEMLADSPDTSPSS